MRRTAAALSLLLALTGCGGAAGGDTARSAGDVGRVSFRGAPDTYLLAAIDGVLGGDAETGCLWHEVMGGERVPLLVAHDTAHLDAAASPPVVRDGDGVWAAFGQRVWSGGGYAQQAVPGCAPAGTAFEAYHLSTTPPQPPPG